MQVLKEDIRNAIVKVAREEIYKNGYKNTSMRVIAEKVNITPGNLYRYFKNKEDIYELIVKPAVNALTGYFNRHHAMHEEFKSENLTNKEILEKVSLIITDLFLGYRKELIILLGSGGNIKYANIKELIIELLSSNIMDHLNELYQKKKLSNNRLLARSLAISLLDGSLEIIKNSKTDSEMIDLMREYIGFYSGFLKKHV